MGDKIEFYILVSSGSKIWDMLICMTGIEPLITKLYARKKDVFLVSGGFRSLIVPVAKQLSIPEENIFANRLKFYFTGDYAGFDENEPTSKSGGKAEVIRRIKAQKGFKTIIHIGDGATDLESCPPADAFIAQPLSSVENSSRSILRNLNFAYRFDSTKIEKYIFNLPLPLTLKKYIS